MCKIIWTLFSSNFQRKFLEKITIHLHTTISTLGGAFSSRKIGNTNLNLTLTSHCALEVGADVEHTLCPGGRVANGVNPGGPGYQGWDAGSRSNLNEQLLQRTWGNRARPRSTEVSVEKATPTKRPFLWKESSTAPSEEKDWVCAGANVTHKHKKMV